MILLDFNQTVVAAVAAMTSDNVKFDENLIRHIVLKIIHSTKSKFKYNYGELVVCCDGSNSWRKDVFPYYKANRKKNRDDSFIDWKSLFQFLDLIIRELKETFPYRVIKCDKMEGDDVIAILATHFHEKHLIVSSDKDFQQLQVFPHISQYCPRKSEYIICGNPKQFLMEQVIRGDAIDGIPNILSDSDTFVIKEKRQKPLRQTKIDEFIEYGIPEEYMQNYGRNYKLISLTDMIPKELITVVLNEYANIKLNTSENLYDYFMKHKLKELSEFIPEF